MWVFKYSIRKATRTVLADVALVVISYSITRKRSCYLKEERTLILSLWTGWPEPVREWTGFNSGDQVAKRQRLLQEVRNLFTRLHSVCALALRQHKSRFPLILFHLEDWQHSLTRFQHGILVLLIFFKILFKIRENLNFFCCEGRDINHQVWCSFYILAHLTAIASMMVMRTWGVHRWCSGRNVDDVWVHQLIFLVQQVKDPDSVWPICER